MTVKNSYFKITVTQLNKHLLEFKFYDSSFIAKYYINLTNIFYEIQTIITGKK